MSEYTETEPLPSGLEQKCIRPGEWMIEGWKVRRVAGSRRAPVRGGSRWDAELFGEEFSRRTLDDVRDEIATRKEMERPL